CGASRGQIPNKGLAHSGHNRLGGRRENVVCFASRDDRLSGTYWSDTLAGGFSWTCGTDLGNQRRAICLGIRISQWEVSRDSGSDDGAERVAAREFLENGHLGDGEGLGTRVPY